MTAEQLKKNLQTPKGKIDVVLDTDAYNEIDDQYAISYMLKSPEKLNVKAIYAAPFYNENSVSPEDGMEKSYAEIIKLLEITDNIAMRKNVYKGSRSYLKSEQIPSESEAARHLCNLADTYTPERPLYIAAIGAITNIASALLYNPNITDKIVIVWLGGHSREYGNTSEFNMMQDIAAARVVFASGAPVIQLPCRGVVSAFSISKQELEYFLLGKNPLCDYLVNRTIEAMDRDTSCDVDRTRVIWDAAVIGWLLNDSGDFMADRITDIRLPAYDNRYSNKRSGGIMTYVYSINRDKLMQNMIAKLTK